MQRFHPRFLEELKKIDPNVREEDLICLAAANLDPVEPSKKSKILLTLTADALTVYADGAAVRTVPLAEISSVQTSPGVGCVSFSYLQKESEEPVLLARADARYQDPLAQFGKRANHYLRYGNTDFSRLSKGSGGTCPRCGKPYPRGMRSCPRCASKKKVIGRLLSVAKPEFPYFLLTVLFFFLVAGVRVLIPLINRRMVDDYILQEEANVFWLGFCGVVLSLLGANIVQRIFGVLRGYFLTISSNRLAIRLRDMVFRKIQELSIAKIADRTAGELMKRVNADTREIRMFIAYNLPNVIEQALMLIGIMVVLFWYDWRLALLILLPAPIAVLAFRVFWRFMRRMFNRTWEMNAKGNAVLHDIFSGIRVVKSYGMEEAEEKRFLDAAGKERDAQLRQERFWALLKPCLDFLIGIGEYILLFYVGQKMLSGDMTPGEMSQFSAYAGMVFAPLSALMMFPRQFMHMMTSMTRIGEIMDEENEMQDNADAEEMKIRGNIDIDRVSFGYDDSKEVLRDIDLHIKEGEFVGLVGRSGVGKSTLINLIMRMYDVDEGAVRIDGVDITQISQKDLRSQMGVVLQETFLFTGTIWQNLTYAKPNATYEEVIQAAKAAGAHEFIIRLPDGYQTYVGERGHTLSGGERQRIAIARALLHDLRILILDEATSALDTETEKLIQDALQMLSKGRTTIAIAHRLSTLRNATRLVVLDDGRVAETGTHEELMAKEGIYYGLVMAQREMTKIESK